MNQFQWLLLQNSCFYSTHTSPKKGLNLSHIHTHMHTRLIERKKKNRSRNSKNRFSHNRTSPDWYFTQNGYRIPIPRQFTTNNRKLNRGMRSVNVLPLVLIVLQIQSVFFSAVPYFPASSSEAGQKRHVLAEWDCLF